MAVGFSTAVVLQLSVAALFSTVFLKVIALAVAMCYLAGAMQAVLALRTTARAMLLEDAIEIESRLIPFSDITSVGPPEKGSILVGYKYHGAELTVKLRLGNFNDVRLLHVRREVMNKAGLEDSIPVVGAVPT